MRALSVDHGRNQIPLRPRVWLGANPSVTFHFTPTGSSWLNVVEIWFGLITRQAIRRGTFTSVNALVVRVRDYVAHCTH